METFRNISKLFKYKKLKYILKYVLLANFVFIF